VQILALYDRLEQLTGNPMVTLNRAVATAMVHGDRLGDHHRLHSVRAHLLEQAGDARGAIAEFEAAAARTTNLRERDYLMTKAARLAAGRG
jgi:predicted RNA polymerase sigma factor